MHILSRLFASVLLVCAAACSQPFSAGQSFRDCADVCPEMVLIPAGSFTMGSPASEPGRYDNEGPQRTVSIARFAAGKYDVTRAQYAAFVQATGRADASDCYTSSGPNGSWRNPGFMQTDNDPVVCVSWNDAQDYARWLSQRTGHTYRLLTEAEWEYAARAGTTSAYWWGDTASHEYANYGSDNCCSGLASGRDQWVNTSPVGSFPANRFGLYDMAGNVGQWVEDCYAESYAGHVSHNSTYETNNCSLRVGRGGSWIDYPQYLRSAYRGWVTPSFRGLNLGFRLARTV